MDAVGTAVASNQAPTTDAGAIRFHVWSFVRAFVSTASPCVCQVATRRCEKGGDGSRRQTPRRDTGMCQLSSMKRGTTHPLMCLPGDDTGKYACLMLSRSRSVERLGHEQGQGDKEGRSEAFPLCGAGRFLASDHGREPFFDSCLLPLRHAALCLLRTGRPMKKRARPPKIKRRWTWSAGWPRSKHTPWQLKPQR